jgi:hypothetical protein
MISTRADPSVTVGPAVWERPCHSGEASVGSNLAILVRHQLPRFTPHRRRLFPYMQLLRKLVRTNGFQGGGSESGEERLHLIGHFRSDGNDDILILDTD